MTHKENITAILECYFAGFNEEIIDSACNRILEQEQRFIAKSDGTIEQIKNCDDCLFKKEWGKIGKLISVVLEKQIEQEPKTGHWIEDTNGTYTDNHDTWECSECGHAQILLEGTPKDNDYNYCPNCGAKMKGDTE